MEFINTRRWIAAADAGAATSKQPADTWLFSRAFLCVCLCAFAAGAEWLTQQAAGGVLV